MSTPAKQAKLKSGEITYDSLFGDTHAMSEKSRTNNDSKSDLTQCTKPDCKILDIATVLRHKSSNQKNSQSTLPITQPILVPLWHQPSNENTPEKTVYYVRGTEVDLNKLDEDGLTGGSESKPQIVYKIVPNTHAHVVRYVMAEDEESINENELFEIVDISKDQRRVMQLSGNSDSISETGIEDDVDDNEYMNTIPLARLPLTKVKSEEPKTKRSFRDASRQQLQTKLPTTTNASTELKDKCRILELKCKWSDQKMAEMQAEMRMMKEEMLQIKRSQNSSNVVHREVTGPKRTQSFKILELQNQRIKEEDAWEEDNENSSTEYLDVMMLDDEFGDEDESQ